MIPHVVAVEALPDYRLRLAFRSGEFKLFDVRPRAPHTSSEARMATAVDLNAGVWLRSSWAVEVKTLASG